MPDGFEPHTELARIYTLKELMIGCRQRLDLVLKTIDAGLTDPDIHVRLKTADMVMDRGFGKPRLHVQMSTENATKRVQIHLPDNGRQDRLGPMVDATREQEFDAVA